MNTTQPLLEHVTISRLKEYLTSKGWTEQIFGRKIALLFVAPPHESRYKWDVLIPACVSIVDYDRVVEIAIDTIAAFEDRTADELLSDMLPQRWWN